MNPKTHNRNLSQAAVEFVRLHNEYQRAQRLLREMLTGSITVDTPEGRYTLSASDNLNSIVIRRW